MLRIFFYACRALVAVVGVMLFLAVTASADTRRWSQTPPPDFFFGSGIGLRTELVHPVRIYGRSVRTMRIWKRRSRSDSTASHGPASRLRRDFPPTTAACLVSLCYRRRAFGRSVGKTRACWSSITTATVGPRRECHRRFPAAF